MQVGQQGGHLILREAAGERGHEAFAGQHCVLDFGVGGGRAAGELGASEYTVQVGRNLLQSEVVIAVAVSAATFVEGHPLQLLPGEGSGAAAEKKDGKSEGRCGDPAHGLPYLRVSSTARGRHLETQALSGL